MAPDAPDWQRAIVVAGSLLLAGALRRLWRYLKEPPKSGSAWERHLRELERLETARPKPTEPQPPPAEKRL